jgi:hypothetical protein
MNSKEEILKLVKDGDITIEEGLELLKSIESKVDYSSINPVGRKPLNKRMLRIDVNSEDGDRVKVNVPLSIAKLGLDLGDNLNINGKTLNLKGIDLEEILNQLDDNSEGEIISVDAEDGSKVRIFID